MSLLQIGVLAVVQGITEFLPISSSGHLVLLPILTGWPDQGLVIDVATHVGTLVAVMLYFWRDVRDMLMGVIRLAQGRTDRGAKLAGHVVVGSVPVVVVGILVHRYAGDSLRDIEVVAWTTVIYSLVLFAADRIGMTVRRIEHLKMGDAILVGLAQALALVPGTSRSGVTMSAARMLGMERSEAARFSMVLSIPATAGAGLLEGYELYKTGNIELAVSAGIGAGLALLTGLVVIWGLMAWLRRSTFTPFVIYRLLLGSVLMVLVYGLHW